MKLFSPKILRERGMSLVETLIAVGIGVSILAAFTTASIALQRSFMAIEDYTKGQNDQMRISDFLSLDMRRAYSVAVATDPTTGFLTVTLVIPNFYQSADTPYDPHIIGVQGWPYKKHHHNKHQNIILNQVVQYGPVTGSGSSIAATTPTVTVTYVFDNNADTLYRSVNGVQTAIATDVKDFSVAVSDLDETATTQITFKPRFRTTASTDAVAGTTYYQTTLTRNTR